MKTIATLVLALAATVAGAVERPRLEVTPVRENKAIVALANERPSLFEISVNAADGTLVYRHETKEIQTGYRKLFDFSGLEDGRYELSVKVNTSTVKRSVTIRDGGLQVGDSELRFDPYFTWSENLLKISYLNFDKDHLRFYIFDTKGETLYESSLGKEFNTIAGYDLKGLDPGLYTVVITGGNKEFVYDLTK